ncbi:MAG: hypothetical protein RBU21_15495 [FCB group bacterium]|jgi:hypothetical protein|nr:hypothetical protein [FCB group bacterium]
MKHITLVSVPSKAAGFPVDHPNLVDSIIAFLEDPEAVIDLHKKVEPIA